MPGTACSPRPAATARWCACPTADPTSRPTGCPTFAASPSRCWMWPASRPWACTTDHQDFLMINQDRAPLTDSREFIDFMEAATPGPLGGILHLFKAHGLGGGFGRLRELFGMLNRKFNGFAAERFNTVAPLCCGPYAVRVRLAPAGNPPPARRSKDIVADMRERLATGNAHLEPRAAVLRRRGDDAHRGHVRVLARRRDADRRGGAAHLAAAGRRCRSGRSRGRPLRSLERPRRPSAAGRGHAGAQGRLLREPEGPQRA